MKNHSHKKIQRPLFWTATLFLVLSLTSCRQPQSPEDYLAGAVDWIIANSITSEQVDWQAVRAEAEGMAEGAQSTAGTYEALKYVIEQLPGSVSWFNEPDDAADLRFFGIQIIDTNEGAFVVYVDPEGPAADLSVRPGDRVEIDPGQDVLRLYPGEPMPWFLDKNPPGGTLDLVINSAADETPKNISIPAIEWPGTWTPSGASIPLGEKNAGYINLAIDSGSDGAYAPHVQGMIAGLDSAQTCGWIIDLRTNGGGDIWSYLAALDPFLDDGQVGGFEYPDGRRDTWEIKDNRVYWDGEVRYESEDIKAGYQLDNPDAPIALLTGPLTNLAAELAVVSLKGQDNVRTFGESTRGHPHFQAVNELDDGAVISVSGAFSFDRSGKFYEGPITPDQPVTIDWQKIGQEDDPLIMAAQEWLMGQADCAD